MREGERIHRLKKKTGDVYSRTPAMFTVSGQVEPGRPLCLLMCAASHLGAAITAKRSSPPPPTTDPPYGPPRWRPRTRRQASSPASRHMLIGRTRVSLDERGQGPFIAIIHLDSSLRPPLRAQSRPNTKDPLPMGIRPGS